MRLAVETRSGASYEFNKDMTAVKRISKHLMEGDQTWLDCSLTTPPEVGQRMYLMIELPERGWIERITTTVVSIVNLDWREDE